jgi:hypothetical protein
VIRDYRALRAVASEIAEAAAIADIGSQTSLT